MKLAVGLVLAHEFHLSTPFFLGFLDLWTRLVSGASRAVSSVNLITSSDFPTDCARNEIIRTFLDSAGEALLFLDADMRHSATLPERLLAHQVDLVTGLYFMRRFPYKATAMVEHPTHPGPNQYQAVHIGRGLQPIAVGGAGALLVRRRALEAIRRRFGDEWFRYQRDPKPPHELHCSEDFWFYQQAARVDVQAYCDFDVVSTHLAEIEVDQAIHDAAVKAQGEAIERELDPEMKQAAVRTMVILGHPGGLVLNDGTTIPAYSALAPPEAVP